MQLAQLVERGQQRLGVDTGGGGRRRRLQRALQLLRQALAHGHASPHTDARAGQAAGVAAAALRQRRNRLRRLVLHQAAHFAADHAHADLLVQHLLQRVGQADALHGHGVELQPVAGHQRRQRLRQRAREQLLAGRQVEERDAGFGNGDRDLLRDQPAQLAVEFGRGVDLARARQLALEPDRVDHTVGVVAEGAQPHGAEFGVAHRDRLRRAPFAVDLLARAEEVDVALEGRFEQLVPVAQVGQQRQRLRAQPVAAGAEHIGHPALVDEQRQLRFAHHQAGAVLDLLIRHRVAPGQHALAVFRPLQDVDELLLDELHQRHDPPLLHLVM